VIVLDTHVLIWAVQDDPRLGRGARHCIERDGHRLIVPALCAWEVAMLDRAGRVPFVGGALAWLRAVLDVPGVALAPLTPEIAVDSAMMPWPHRDPADRMIVATARALDCALVTADEQILRYAAAGHVRAIDARG
jgi:PIN domain nuclease of toxin-antitoxin system